MAINDGDGHSTTSLPTSRDSSDAAPDGPRTEHGTSAYYRDLHAPGDYTFVCEVHVGMDGTVTVRTRR